MTTTETRRAFFAMAGAATVLAACRDAERSSPLGTNSSAPKGGASATAEKDEKGQKEDGEEEEVGATEDLMREHGVLRRILVVYRESAAALRTNPKSVSTDALQKAAKLFRTFGEDYHEKQLEEAHIFPAVKARGGAAAAEIETLLAQHQRAREITDYLLAVSAKPIGASASEPLARTLESLARMYEEHAAREDTIVFPGWKKALSPKQLDEMGELFEDIEHKTFGKDGFDDALEQIAAIERAISLDPAALLAPPPPKA